MSHKWAHRTRGGAEVFVYDVDVPEPNEGYTVMGRVMNGGRWIPMSWTADGRPYGARSLFKGVEHDLDLMRNRRFFPHLALGDGGDAA